MAKKQKARKIHIWQSNGGALSIADMETDHLLNTVAYLQRRQDEFIRIRERAVANNQLIPSLIISGHTVDNWVEIMMDELDYRTRKEVGAARAFLRSIQNG